MQERSNISRKEEATPGRTLHLKFSTLLVLAFISCFAIALAYIGGVMTGRNTAPAKPAVEIVQRNALPEKVEDDSEKSNGKILAPRDLEFARILRGEAAASQEKPAPAPPSTPVEQIAAADAQRQESKPESPPIQEDAPGGMYDYVLQMGVFKDENAADNLRQQLEGYGLRTALERGGKTFVVLIKMRGDAGRLAEISRIAASLRLGEPLLRSRKAVKN